MLESGYSLVVPGLDQLDLSSGQLLMGMHEYSISTLERQASYVPVEDEGAAGSADPGRSHICANEPGRVR